MAERELDLGWVVRLRAEALGRPGQRRFRVVAEGPGGSAMVWLEKEELHRLALAVTHLLELLSSKRAFSPGTPPQPRPARRDAALEFQAEVWAVGYDEGQNALEFVAYDQAEDSGPPRLRFQTTRDQARTWSEEAFRVYAAGRPVCALCGLSLDPGVPHVCPRANGHLHG